MEETEMHQSDAAQDISHKVTATRERHDNLTIALHWITALLVIAQFTLAFVHDQAIEAQTRSAILAAHRSLGTIIWFVVAGRLLRRVVWMRLPAFPATMTGWHRLGAMLSEWALYALLLTQPLSGLAASLLGGRPFDLFWAQVPVLVRPDQSLVATFQSLHMLGAYSLAALVLIHASAAILHRILADDGVLGSMMPPFVSRNRGGFDEQSSTGRLDQQDGPNAIPDVAVVSNPTGRSRAH
jgi:cytochrome b561